jgi:hypothetical protein
MNCLMHRAWRRQNAGRGLTSVGALGVGLRPDDGEHRGDTGSLLMLRALQNVRINPASRWTSRPKQALLSTDR